ncbi:MAG: ATP-binding cassette domain-containing protein [Candidatus Omnitrophota bacterium]
MALLTVRNLSKKFGEEAVLDKVEFQLEERKFVSIVGPSRGGKTVLLKIIAGLEKPDEGEVLLEGRPVAEVVAREPKTVAIFQDYPPYRREVAGKKLPYFIMFRRWRRQVMEERVEVISDLMEIARKTLLGMRSHPQSRGQEQRLDLARYLLAIKRVALLDNPLLNLDIVWKKKILDNLKVTLERLNLAAIYATHDKTEAQIFTQKVFVLEKGKVIPG